MRLHANETSSMPEARLVRTMTAGLRLRRLRSLVEFAEAEIIVPTGPKAGLPYRADTQPAHRLYLEAAASRRWRRIVATGPQQSGKTLACFVIPTLYHLFEMGERVIWGVPDKDLAANKWASDIYPTIACSPRLRAFLPETGEGSKGGRVETNVRFSNGADLVIMSAGGGDKSRSSITGRVVVITETDGLDTAQRTSAEADPVEQIVGRTRAYHDSRIYMECTVSTERGRTWREYREGTESRIMLRCPHCSEWVTPGRDHLIGWKDAESVSQARRDGRLVCPSCATAWTEAERRLANASCRLVHRGQEIDSAGEVSGDPPETDTLGFRWTAANNLIVPISECAAEEWKAARDPDDAEGELKMCQWFWAQPPKDAATTTAGTIASRLGETPRGIVPAWATTVTCGVDCGKHRCHWVAIAWSDRARGIVIDYGELYVPSESMAEEIAVQIALREFRDNLAEKGWARLGGEVLQPSLSLIDSGWLAEPVYQFAMGSNDAYMASKGQGVSQYGSGGRYLQRKSTGSKVSHVGDGYHVSRLQTPPVDLLEFDADRWKTVVHRRLAAPVDADGSLSLFRVAKPIEHHRYASQLVVEQQVQEYAPGRGLVTVWKHLRGANHYLDATVLATVAAHATGISLVGEHPQQRPASAPRSDKGHGGATTPDGRDFLITYRQQGSTT